MGNVQIENVSIIDDYVSWLRQNMSEHVLKKGIAEITVPFLNHLNDHLQFYVVKNPNGTYTLNDDGQTILELTLQGVNVENKRRKEQIQYICRTRGVNLSEDKNILEINSTYSQLPQAKHMLIQTMMAVSNMYMLSRSNVQSLFVEDVSEFLDKHGVIYSRDLQIVGVSGYTNHIDFVIPKNQNRQEILLNVIGRIDVQSSKILLFSLNEIKAVRKTPFDYYLFFDDIHGTATDTSMEAYRNYGVEILKWSERDQEINKIKPVA